jgi:hypothetical protein
MGDEHEIAIKRREMRRQALLLRALGTFQGPKSGLATLQDAGTGTGAIPDDRNAGQAVCSIVIVSRHEAGGLAGFCNLGHQRLHKLVGWRLRALKHIYSHDLMDNDADDADDAAVWPWCVSVCVHERVRGMGFGWGKRARMAKRGQAVSSDSHPSLFVLHDSARFFFSAASSRAATPPEPASLISASSRLHDRMQLWMAKAKRWMHPG